MRIEILPEARDDLIAGFRFYERQAPGLGSLFSRARIRMDVDALAAHGGVHAKVLGYHLGETFDCPEPSDSETSGAERRGSLQGNSGGDRHGQLPRREKSGDEDRPRGRERGNRSRAGGERWP